ncbi:helix-turn-helix domain-containing protein [Mobilitalea sibirica]|nr:helix-turn-helix domain-containing protein [Mobilitalea sibirica]
MDLNENIKNNIQRLRKERNVTQDVLAAALDISIQAVSKWETGSSLPDIMQIPRIAKFFGVTIDYLFYNEGKEEVVIYGELPDDDTLRIVQFRGKKMLGAETWEKDKNISLKIPEDIINGESKIELHTEIWGNANIEGNISGNVNCGGKINCGNIGGNAICQEKINCGNIGGNAECNEGINSGNIGGNATCSDKINCGDIEGSVKCEGNINCGEISGNVNCTGDILCGIIESGVECKGTIRCKEIKGDVHCEGDIIYEK